MRKKDHAVRNLDPLGQGEAVEQQHVTGLVETAERFRRCPVPDRVPRPRPPFAIARPFDERGQEMCLTERFDPGDGGYLAIKRELMRGIALKGIATMGEVDRALETAGFRIVEGIDRGEDVPWYRPMETRRGTPGNALRRVPLGRKAIFGVSRLAELLRLFPKGSADVVRFMDRTANAYVAGGRTGIFTPLYCFLARKPD